MTTDEIELEITVKFRIKHLGTLDDLMQFCRDIDIDPSPLVYARWLANEEGLMGIVEDGYVITNAAIVQRPL